MITINFSLQQAKIHEDMKLYTGDDADDESDQSDCEVEGEMDTRAKPELGYVQHQKYRDGVLTIGCVGKVLRLLLNDRFRPSILMD